jgi:TPR repeat protein
MNGQGVEHDVEAAAWYLSLAAEAAAVTQHTPGQERSHELIRLNRDTEAKVADGQRGADDALIEYQVCTLVSSAIYRLQEYVHIQKH